MPSPVASTETFGPLNEATSGQYTATIRDETAAVLPLSLITAATLTLYAPTSPVTVINSRSAQDVLNANGVTIDEDGLLTWMITPADTAISDATLDTERHVALFHFTWGGDKGAWHEVVLIVRNLVQVGA